MAYEWDDIRFFLALAHTGSIRRAAKKLRVNHSTVLRRINHLEERGNVRLFDRLPHGYTLTEVGQEIVNTAKDIESMFLGLELRMYNRDTRLTGKIRVTFPEILLDILGPIFVSFSQTYPDIELEVSMKNQVSSLSRREADIAFRITQNPPKSLIGRRIGKILMAPYASLSYLEKHADTSNLKAHSWIRWESMWQSFAFEQWISEYIPTTQICAVVDSLCTAYDFIAKGMGIGFMACHTGEHKTNLRRVANPHDNIGFEVWLLSHKDLRRTPRIRAFLDFVSSKIKMTHFSDNYTLKPQWPNSLLTQKNDQNNLNTK